MGISSTFRGQEYLFYRQRNLLYNGAMQVAQRGTSTASITADGYYTADRWYTRATTLGTWTQSVENDAPTGSGFRKSTKMLCTTADASPSSADILTFRQGLEGQDLQDIRKGTSNAQYITFSFWVKSNVTGTYILDLQDNDNSRQVSASYTISASGVWEYKVITFPPDTTGAFDDDNNGSFYASWFLAAGSNFTSGTLNTSWGATTNANRAVGQTNLASATNNYWQITGVQLNVGPVATPFEQRPYGVELALCQRYYYLLCEGNVKAIALVGYISANRALGPIYFPVTMRTAPTLFVVSGTNYYYAYSSAQDDFNAFILSGAGANVTHIDIDTNLSGTTGYAAHVTTNNAASRVAFGAEL